MIFWSGWGILVAVIQFFILVVTEKTVESFYSDSSYYQLHKWPGLLAFILGAMATYILSKYLATQKGRVVIDKKTKKEFTLEKKHTLFFIDIKHWPIILIVLGFLYCVL